MNWLDLNMRRNTNGLLSLQSLRPGDENVRQYAEDGKTRIAVRSTQPYGELSDPRDPAVNGLFEVVDQGPDFTIFDLPEEALALKALTLGTGRREAQTLDDTYHRVGSTVTRILKSGVQVSGLGIEDIAVGRRTGEVYLIPPIDFVKSEPGVVTEATAINFVRSLDDLRGSLSDSDVNRFEGLIIKGMHDA